MMHVTQAEIDKLLENKNSGSTNSLNTKVSAEVIDNNILKIIIGARVLSASESDIIISRICYILEDTRMNMIFDLSKCSYLSSTVLGAIVHIATKQKKDGFSIIFLGANEVIKNLIKITNVDKLVNICDSEEIAMELLRNYK